LYRNFKLSFNDRVKEVRPCLKVLRKAIDEVRNSKFLRDLLGVVLAIGNYMNGGTKRGQADGFKLDFIPKLMDTKDAHNQKSLMEYAITQLVTKNPDSVGLPDELK
jgi:hypothetical protein